MFTIKGATYTIRDNNSECIFCKNYTSLWLRFFTIHYLQHVASACGALFFTILRMSTFRRKHCFSHPRLCTIVLKKIRPTNLNHLACKCFQSGQVFRSIRNEQKASIRTIDMSVDPLPNDNTYVSKISQIGSICRRQNKCHSNLEICLQKGRKRGEKKGNCWLQAFSPFSKLF